MNAKTRRLVRTRAGNCCEYCGLHQDQSPLSALQIEHVIPKKHSGSDAVDNLALACIDCNLAKSSNIAGLDPQTSHMTELFHPRIHVWHEHFTRRGPYLHGTTPIGRTTVQVLNMNSNEQIELRSMHVGD